MSCSVDFTGMSFPSPSRLLVTVEVEPDVSNMLYHYVESISLARLFQAELKSRVFLKGQATTDLGLYNAEALAPPLQRNNVYVRRS